MSIQEKWQEDQSSVKVLIEKCDDDTTMPGYANPGDAGMDICAAKDVELRQGETKIIPTGLKFAIPDGYEIQVRPRSGISFNTPLRISNSPGTVDSGYRDELGIIMTNTSCACYSSDEIFTLGAKGNQKGIYHIKKGDRIAQILIAPVYKIKFEQAACVRDIGEDRGGGFGSSGV